VTNLTLLKEAKLTRAMRRCRIEKPG